MLKFLLYGLLVYLAVKVYQGLRKMLTHPGGGSPREQDPYRKMDIQDADFEDLDQD